MDLECIHGWMVVSIVVNGCPITWKVMASIHGKMVVSTKDSIEKTRRMGLASTSGQMAESMKVTGPMENSMVLVHMLYLRKIWQSLAYGKMENELNGLILQRHDKLLELHNTSNTSKLLLALRNVIHQVLLILQLTLIKTLINWSLG